MKLLKNQAGVTMLEIVFALGILTVGTYIVVKGVDNMQDMTRDTRNMSSTERQIAMIVDNIRTSLGQYQINFTYDKKSRDEELELAKLPMEWDAGTERPLSEDCKTKNQCMGGRYGFVVQPIEQYRGLYMITLRMTHTSWPEKYRDYEFLVTVQ